MPERGNVRPALTLRVDLGRRGALGPGKINLLEAIRAGEAFAADRVRQGLREVLDCLPSPVNRVGNRRVREQVADSPQSFEPFKHKAPLRS